MRKDYYFTGALIIAITLLALFGGPNADKRIKDYFENEQEKVLIK